MTIRILIAFTFVSITLIGCKKPISDEDHIQKYRQHESLKFQNAVDEATSEASKQNLVSAVQPITAKDVQIMEYHVARLEKEHIEYDINKVVQSQAYRDTLAIQNGKNIASIPDTSLLATKDEIDHDH